MTLTEKNVIQFNDGKSSVYETILTFLKRKEQNSQNTANTYLRHFTDFFQIMRNKDLNQLTEKDLIFTKQEIEEYQVNMRNKYKTATVNNAMSSLKSLYNRLSDDFNVNPKLFDLETYKESDKTSRGVLKHDEISQIIELVKSTQKGDIKQLLIKVAYATAFRIDAILRLEWNNIEWNENGYWTITAFDKGQKFDTKKISNDLYEELIEHKKKSTDKYIFKIDKKTINRMMNYIRKSMDFGNRHIVFHSFKKASITTVGIQTNWNPTIMKRQGNHSKIETTFEYVPKPDLDEMPIVDVNQQVETTQLENISHELLIEVIHKADMETKIKLNRILKELKK